MLGEFCVPVGFRKDVGGLALLVGVVAILVLLVEGFDLLFGRLEVLFEIEHIESHLLGGDDLLVEIVLRLSSGGVGDDSSAEDFGEILSGDEILDVFVESLGANSESTDLFVHELGEGFPVESAFGL